MIGVQAIQVLSPEHVAIELVAAGFGRRFLAFLLDSSVISAATTLVAYAAAPLPGGNLDFAGMVFNSPYGLIVSEWRKTTAGMIYKLTVPANTTAEVCFPAHSLADISENGRPVAAQFEVVNSDSVRPAIKLAAGTYEFEIILTGFE